MSIQPAGGRYSPDPYATLNLVALGIMIAGTLLFVWEALGVAGLIPPPPWIFPPVDVLRQAHLQAMIYALTAVCIGEHVALPQVMRAIKPQPNASDGSLDRTRMLIRFAYAIAIWIYIVVLWAVTLRHETGVL